MHRVDADGPRPQDSDHVAPADVDKHPARDDVTMTGAVFSDQAKKEDDNTSNNEEFQDGVKRVRAITTAWSKWSLFPMFALYVPRPQASRIKCCCCD